MRIISHDSSLLENYFFWLVKFSKIRQTFFAKYPNILIEQHLSISLIFTTIISSHHPLSIIVLQTNTQRYVKSRDIECSLSREDTSRPSTKSEMIFFFLHFQAECEQRVDDVTQGGGFRPVLMSESPPKETAKKAGTMVSAKRVHRWWDEGKRDKRKRRKGRGRGAESFATTSAERYYRR